LAPGDQILTHTSTQKISSTIQTIESKWKTIPTPKPCNDWKQFLLN
jgi:hypothetical protein